MARKTFISYKHSESQGTRDKIIRALGTDASYYQGETSASPDLGDLKTQTIKNKLADMIFSTSVLIVVISANIDKSSWVKWEINYATNCQTRNDRQSQPNGVVMVLEDSMVNSENKYTHNQTTSLITEKSKPVAVKLSDFLNNPSYFIEKAYNNASN